MRLADFMEAESEAILREWEPFAATLLPAARHLDSAGLRDHAEEILKAIVADLRTSQTAEQRDLKARGLTGGDVYAAHTAAQTHATLRAACGFTAQQLVSEYRALRASILRLWLSGISTYDGQVFEDMCRLNEAVDQAVAESVDYFTGEQERWRNIFLGVLGHELRGPLDAIMLTARLLERMPDGSPTSAHVARMTRSGQRMKSLLDDLLDFNRGALGLGISVSKEPIDMVDPCLQEIEQQRALAAGQTIELQTSGDTKGRWDADRVRQLLGNLLSNALKYGDGATPVLVRLEGRANEVAMSVSNSGPSVPADRLETLFEPLRRVPSANAQAERTSLGLGLYIVKAIARAHGAATAVESSGHRTVFTVTWPK
jgi:signal transduction histidine kinase